MIKNRPNPSTLCIHLLLVMCNKLIPCTCSEEGEIRGMTIFADYGYIIFCLIWTDSK